MLLGKEVREMAHRKITSARVASRAARILRNPNASKTARSIAASALAQRPGRRHRA